MSEILKPGRYIDNEWNAVHKEWKGGILKFAVCFPDIYEVGMSHLGIKILYGILNNEKDVLCERAFAPWGDMEEKIKKENGLLLSMESKTPLKDFDIVGFSLQYEMGFVDVLNMLELGGIRRYRSMRTDADPLVIAGGPCAFNPTVLEDFIDAFVIGEAEEAILEIMDVVRNSERSRARVLQGLSKVEGVYVPGKNSSVKKRIVKDMDSSFFPVDPVVPYIQVVHDRVSIEIMRGCPHQCKFCQACRIFHPLRMRSVERLLDIAKESIKNTGYDEIGLLSLSTGDYPFLEELVKKLEENFKGKGIRLSLPSLRARNFNEYQGSAIIKRRGLTFAPEAGSDRLRNTLNKKMKNEDIVKEANSSLESGWNKVKLYFMLGLPGEAQEDIEAIIELALQIKRVSLSVSPFIPKPFSGFEREGMNSLSLLEEKIAFLRARSRKANFRNGLKIDFHNPKMSRIEAVLSLGDKEVGRVIDKAWEKGLRLQAWDEHFNYRAWEESFNESSINPDIFLEKRPDAKPLPWAF